MNKKQYTKSIALLSVLVILEPAVALADTAISVPRDARAAIENAKNDFRSMESRKSREKAEAGYKKEAADYVDRAEAEVLRFNKELNAAKARVACALLNLEKANAEQAAAQEALNEAEAYQQEMRQKMQDAYEQAEQASLDATTILQASWDKENEIQRLVDQASLQGRELEGAPEQYMVDWSKVPQAQARAERLLAAAKSLEPEAGAADRVVAEKNGQLYSANQQAAMAVQEVQLAREAESAFSDALTQAGSNREKASAMQEDLLYRLAHPAPPGSYSAISEGMRYYYWKDGAGSSGYQLSQPLYYAYAQKPYSLCVSANYILAHNGTSGTEGSIHTLTDTYISLSKQAERGKYSLDYLLGVNVPTGKASLNASQRNARMSDDLVEFDPYGKGWQVNPGIQVSWLTAETDKWSAGTDYLWSHAYDPTSDISHDAISPGFEWRRYLRYQHAEKSWQFVAEIINTAYGTTTYQENDSYHLSDGWKYRVTYNKEIGNNQEVLFYYWLENAGRNDQAIQGANNTYAHYFGTMWNKKVDEKSTFRVSFDILDTGGDRYDGIRSYRDSWGNPQYYYTEVTGRTKYTFGVGYDKKISDSSRWSVDLQYFHMKDGQSNLGDLPKEYNGYNACFLYSKAL